MTQTKFKVFIHNVRDKKFITSYQHPLTKQRLRTSFLDKKKAMTHKNKIEKKIQEKLSFRA